MSHTDDRGRLRAELRARRDALGAAQRIAASQALAAKLEQIPELLTDQRVAGYWAVGGELPLAALMQGLRARRQRYHLPVIVAAQRLRFAPWQPGDAIALNRYSIPEPATAADAVEPTELDVILLPLVGFDRCGWRLGSGGGYYDRSLGFLRERDAMAAPILVGVGYAMQEVEAIAPMPWDVRLDYVATERELIECMPARD